MKTYLLTLLANLLIRLAGVRLGVCETIDCDEGVPDVVIPNCGDIDFGQKIVKIFIARDDADNLFADTTELATEAEWDSRLAISATGATAKDRIVAIGNLHQGLKPPTEDETEEGPYGGLELVTRTHTATFEIKRWNTALITAVNLVRCRDSYRLWYLTNTGFLFGDITGFEDTSTPAFSEAEAPYLIYHRADPQAWGVIELDATGNALRQATVELAEPQRPILAVVSERTVTLEWLSLERQIVSAPLPWTLP